MMSFRDFLALENRRALQSEVVNEKNIPKQNETMEKKKLERFYILKGNSMKIDYQFMR